MQQNNQVDPQPCLYCIVCGTKIAKAAGFCAACSHYQKHWKNIVLFWGRLAGLISVIGTATLFGISNLQGAKDALFASYRLVILSLNSDSGMVIANAGNRDVFLSHMAVKYNEPPLHFSKTMSIDGLVRKKEIATAGFNTSMGARDYVAKVSDKEWSEILQRAQGATTGDECFRSQFLLENGREYQQIKEFLKQDLRTFKPQAALYYYAADQINMKEQPILILGVVTRSRAKECRAVETPYVSEKGSK